ncbi:MULTISPECIES: CDP-glycerol glycerophosphotransferase family protein [unclassified Pseudomonas]|uniref:CDP-glycerol glycerophosphotransferase family protein n=1 Tax=unclassified Pseudomonas TaxID=196821 RepID=UPI0009F23398|nr:MULTISPECIES: CDP-glycerol glycerophosphotransferase family protein [unclassified Pseudomonas]
MFRKAIFAAGAVLLALLSRVFAYPLTLVVPRDAFSVLVLGREHGKFLDNAKHCFCYLQDNAAGWRCAFLTESNATASMLQRQGIDVLRYPSWPAFIRLLRTGILVVDSMDYGEHGRIGLIRGARVIQLWHGAPLKEIELDLHHRRLARLSPLKRWLVIVYKSVLGRYRRTDLLVSTSEYFTEQAFRRSFHAKSILALGYPRNDAMLDPQRQSGGLVNCNVDVVARQRIHAHRESGGKVIAYMPTFRKNKISPFETGHMDLQRLSIFCERVGVLFVLKLHPLMHGRYRMENSPFLVNIDPDSDIYPLLASVDILITDYSSIYFDFLLLNRPVVFYPYDLDEYLRDDRSLLFSYPEMTPGAHAHTFDDLLACLEEQVVGVDEYVEKRERVLRLTFDHRDAAASVRLLKHLGSMSL